MLISGREAALRLEAVGLARRQSRRLLATGLAGEPVRAGSAALFDAARVDELVRRPVADAARIDRACPAGLFVARRDVPVGAPREQQLTLVRDAWDFSIWTSAWLRSRIQVHDSFPVIVTVAGFVLLGADLVQVQRSPVRGGGRSLALDDPGDWFAALEGHRVPTGPGRDWVLHERVLREPSGRTLDGECGRMAL